MTKIFLIIFFSLTFIQLEFLSTAYATGPSAAGAVGGSATIPTTGEAVAGAAAGAAQNAVIKEGTTAAVDAAAPGLSEKIGNFLSSPPGIMAVSAIGTANSMILYKAAALQEEEAEENIKKIERVMATLRDTFSNFCPNGRERLEEPNCYCFLEGGKQNPNRSNSKICQDLFNKNKYFLNSTPGVYKALTAKIDPVGCVAVNGQFDEGCKCKKLVDNKGNNACMKSVGLNVSGNGLGAAFVSASGFDKVMSNLASTASGNSNIGNINDRLLGLAIAKQGDLSNALFDKLASDPNKKMFPKLDSNEDINKLQKALFSNTDMNKLGSTLGGSPLDVNPGSLSGEKAKLIQDIKKKVGIDSYGSGKGSQKGSDKNASGMNFNFLDSGSASNSGSGQVQDFGGANDQKYKYKNSDIVTDEGASLFEIISNRYIQSGLRRLFEE